MSVNFFQISLTQWWSGMVFWNPFLDRIDQRWFIWNPFSNNADHRLFFQNHSETALISVGFLNPFWDSADEIWLFQTHSDTAMNRLRCFESILNRRWSALVSLISFYINADKRWFFEPIPNQRWSTLDFENLIWNSANRRGFYQIHSETALLFLIPTWKSADLRFFKKTVPKQRWSAMVFLTFSEMNLISAGFLSLFRNHHDHRWLFKIHFQAAMISAGFFWNHSETALVS